MGRQVTDRDRADWRIALLRDGGLRRMVKRTGGVGADSGQHLPECVGTGKESNHQRTTYLTLAQSCKRAVVALCIRINTETCQRKNLEGGILESNILSDTHW